MRLTAVHAQTERKRQERSARCAEKHHLRARTRRLTRLIRPVSAACATAGTAQGGKRLSGGRIQAIFASDSRPLGECRLILKTIKLPGLVLAPIFKGTRFLASIYYALFSCQFSREHKAVLAGKAAYQQSLKDIGETSVLLRRNIHRLEKGLIMQPRRDVFAENFIGETV